MVFIWKPNRSLAHQPAVDTKRCRSSVSHGRGGLYQCSRAATVFRRVEGETGEIGFCAQHDPEHREKLAQKSAGVAKAQLARNEAIERRVSAVAKALGVYCAARGDFVRGAWIVRETVMVSLSDLEQLVKKIGQR